VKVFEKPIIDMRELLRAIDPVHGQGASDYESMREANLLSHGVWMGRPHDTDSTRALALYCSLNRDAVSSARRGHLDTAAEIRGHAERIEREQIQPWLEAAVGTEQALPTVIPEDVESARAWREWLDRALFGGGDNGQTKVAEPVLEAAREVAEVRSNYEGDDLNVRLTIGRVWRIEDHLTEVRPESLGESYAFPTKEVFAAGLRLGDPVVIRHEELSPGVFLTTFERGIESARRISRLSGQALPTHLGELLKSVKLRKHQPRTRPLRQLS
jgi:hypothetical protein